ncbi:hypothetical protein VTL71DRAFT_5100 [Oculimacula yallundae]|uniref:Uncharacterized protein n=1 Tax=Oculimacula yallundae TaxID=86028 RepID=A0ABR4C064_9HELO
MAFSAPSPTRSNMAPTPTITCHLRPSVDPQETWHLMGFTPQQILEKMTHHLQALEHNSVINNDWAASTEAYNEGNSGHTIYMDLPGSKQQDRDFDLLKKRFTLISKIILAGLFPPYTLNVRFVREGTMEWTANHNGLCVDGDACSNRSMLGTTPSTLRTEVRLFERPRVAYACPCGKCQGNVQEGEGVTGHGPVWMDVWREVEKAMLRLFGYRCWLGRSQSLACEDHAYRRAHSLRDMKANEVNEMLYCEARINYGRNEMDESFAFREEDFVCQGDGKRDDSSVESDCSSEDETEYSFSGSIKSLE